MDPPMPSPAMIAAPAWLASREAGTREAEIRARIPNDLHPLASLTTAAIYVLF